MIHRHSLKAGSCSPVCDMTKGDLPREQNLEPPIMLFVRRREVGELARNAVIRVHNTQPTVCPSGQELVRNMIGN